MQCLKPLTCSYVLQSFFRCNTHQFSFCTIETIIFTETIKELSKILRINIRVVSSAGSIYLHQLSNIFNDVLNVYRLYSEQIIQACAQQGPIATRLTVYKAMRGVKTDILELFIACLDACREVIFFICRCLLSGICCTWLPLHDHVFNFPSSLSLFSNLQRDEEFDSAHAKELFNQNFLPSIMNEVLQDYHASPPAARDHKVRAVFPLIFFCMRYKSACEVIYVSLILSCDRSIDFTNLYLFIFPPHRCWCCSALRSACSRTTSLPTFLAF